jgi:poly(3-hydroxybutyrate) depolymerase
MACRVGFSLLLLLVIFACASPSLAATTATLPPWVCAHPDAIFVDGFQTAATVIRLPSNGSGGATGSVSRSVSVPGYGTHTIHLRVPASYSPTQPMPLVLALHGQAGPGAANNAALSVRNTWSSIADANGFIVVAPVGTGASGGWIAPPPNPSDYSIMAAAIADVEAAYNIDQSRRIGWGFSAGGHVMHDIMLNDFGAPVSIDTFAAYSVSAGVLEGFACSNPTTCDALVATAARRIPLDIHVGNGDPLAPYALSDRDIFLANGWIANNDLWLNLFVGGHNFTAPQLGEVWAHLCKFQVLP